MPAFFLDSSLQDNNWKKSSRSSGRRGDLYGGSGFREKTLRWEIAIRRLSI